MARKGNQQKNGLVSHGLKHKKGASGGVLPGIKGHAIGGQVKDIPGEEVANGNQSGRLLQNASETMPVGNKSNNELKSEKISRKDKQGMVAKNGLEEPFSFGINSGDGSLNSEVQIQEENGTSPRSNRGQQSIKSRLSCLLNGLPMKSVVEKVEHASNVVRRLRLSASSVFTAVAEWLTMQKPLFISLTAGIFKAYDHLRMKIEEAYPIFLDWLIQFGSIMLLLSVLWLDCALRGINSFVCMGTTSFFSILWCSIFSVISIIGMLKFLVIVGLAALIGYFVGLTLAILVVAILGIFSLLFYSSFWTAAFFIILGGDLFAFMCCLDHLLSASVCLLLWIYVL